MSFDAEWAALKAEAAQRRSTRMQLNQLPPDSQGGGVPQGDLAVSQTDLAAIGDAAFQLHQDLDRDGDHARAATAQAASSLKADFAIGAALDHVATRWSEQLRSVVDACAHISNHLDYTRNAHAGDEVYLATVTSQISTLDQGFDERTQR
jgi:acyl-CoA thioesterase FadM